MGSTCLGRGHRGSSRGAFWAGLTLAAGLRKGWGPGSAGRIARQLLGARPGKEGLLCHLRMWKLRLGRGKGPAQGHAHREAPAALHLSSDPFTNLHLTSALGPGLYQALGYRDQEDPWDLKVKRGVSRKPRPAWNTRGGLPGGGALSPGFWKMTTVGQVEETRRRPSPAVRVARAQGRGAGA